MSTAMLVKCNRLVFNLDYCESGTWPCDTGSLVLAFTTTSKASFETLYSHYPKQTYRKSDEKSNIDELRRSPFQTCHDSRSAASNSQ